MTNDPKNDSTNGSAKTVLVVEDNELNMKLFHDLLEANSVLTGWSDPGKLWKWMPERRFAPWLSVKNGMSTYNSIAQAGHRRGRRYPRRRSRPW